VLAGLQTEQIPAVGVQYASYITMCEQADALLPTSDSTSTTNTKRQSISTAIASENPYAVHSQAEIAGKWARVQTLIPHRHGELTAEASTQAARNGLKIQWKDEGIVLAFC
jgi:hypothetical protein